MEFVPGHLHLGGNERELKIPALSIMRELTGGVSHWNIQTDENLNILNETFTGLYCVFEE